MMMRMIKMMMNIGDRIYIYNFESVDKETTAIGGSQFQANLIIKF